jgi:hypothetical protein
MNAPHQPTTDSIAATEDRLLALEDRVCSHGDTVHYAEKPKIFERCAGSYLWDLHGHRYLDLQMWYSAVNLGYANPVVHDALLSQMNRLPQLACQYLHREKIELAQMLCESVERAFGMKGRVHFNVGGSQAIEDALKLVRKNTGRQHMLAFQGGYHGRTLPGGVRGVCRPGGVPAVSLRLPFAFSRRRAQDGGSLRPGIREPFRTRIHRSMEPEDRALGIRRALHRGRPGNRRLHRPAEELLQAHGSHLQGTRHPRG